MNFIDLFNLIKDYGREIDDVHVVNNLIQNAFGDWLASKKINQISFLSDGKVVLNVSGKFHRESSQISYRGVRSYDNFIVIELDQFSSFESLSEAIEKTLQNFAFDGEGAYVWIVPDGFMASLSDREKTWEADGGGYFSHESICVSNTSDFDTICDLEILYENLDLENVSCEFEIKAHRSVHFRLDKLEDDSGEPLIKKDQPTSYKIVSRSAKVVVQGSRILTSGDNSEFASFGTVMAWFPIR